MNFFNSDQNKSYKKEKIKKNENKLNAKKKFEFAQRHVRSDECKKKKKKKRIITEKTEEREKNGETLKFSFSPKVSL